MDNDPIIDIMLSIRKKTENCTATSNKIKFLFFLYNLWLRIRKHTFFAFFLICTYRESGSGIFQWQDPNPVAATQSSRVILILNEPLSPGGLTQHFLPVVIADNFARGN